MPLEMRLVQKQTQKLILSPQMQQAIYLLQLPLMELKSLVEQEMVENPVLEETKGEEQKDQDSESDENNNHEEESNNLLNELDEAWKNHFEEDVYIPPNRNPKEASELHDFLETLITKDVTLDEHLLGQLRLQNFSSLQSAIGEYIIGNLNDDGYLTVSTEEIAQKTGATPVEVELVLAQIQLFDPVGIAARSLQECLQVQMISMGKQNHLAYKILTKPIELLERKKYHDLAKMLKMDVQDIQKAVEFLSKLEPKPGREFSSKTTMYVIPDVILSKVEGEYVIVTNDSDLPKLRINKLYQKLYKDKTNDKETRKYIREKIQSAMWLIKNIHHRQKTIYRITEEIIRTQKDFLDNGLSHLKPLTLKEIADVLSLNLSTISRAVMNKYIQTPQGTFEIRKLFSTSLPKDDGSTSAIHVQHKIADLITNEDPKKPISDQEITNILTKNGIKIARRTVAKYREEKLKIAPSNLRKKF
ncbi:RNA polymerase factor sigma-54 [PVC group bacterium]|nr:RNA polymerase factor sigma-54 [PVC group bacterium]